MPLKRWRALEGPPKEVFFAQDHEPGRLCASDFTHMTELGVTIAGDPFEHLVYHLVLTYSHWETGTVCFSESWESLCDGLQNALWELGGVPRQHRTDRLTAAVKADPDPEHFTQRYQALVAHFSCEVEEPEPLPEIGKEIGVDVGDPRWYRKVLRELRVLQRKISRAVLGGSMPEVRNDPW